MGHLRRRLTRSNSTAPVAPTRRVSKPPPSDEFGYVPPPDSFLFCAVFVGACTIVPAVALLAGREPTALLVSIVASGIPITALHLWLWRRQTRAFNKWRKDAR